MNDSLYIAAAGMQAQQVGLNAVANNLVNINTAGYKREKVSFREVIQQQVVDSEQKSSPKSASAGISVAGVERVFAQGEIKLTGSPLDLAIDGVGFFEILLPDGASAYMRGGSLKIDKEGFLSTQAGHVLKPSIRLPLDVTDFRIGADGRVWAGSADSKELTEIGRLELANFANPSGLTALGGGLYLANEISGTAIFGRPGEQGLGAIVQGQLEGSNVKLSDEMVSMMLAQRAYELASKVIQASDELMSITNGLRR